MAVEDECKKIGLQLNAKKTKVVAYNIDDNNIATLDGTVFEVLFNNNSTGVTPIAV